MRRLFLPSCIAAAICLALGIASLWSLFWVSPGCGTRLGLGQGCLWLWAGSAGDFSGTSGPGFYGGSWTGDSLLWKPEFDPAQKMWVATQVVLGGAVVAKQITGLSIGLPLYIPLILSAGSAGLTYLPWRRHRRIARGQCARCGYDLTGLAGRCPECGTALGRALRIVKHWLVRRPGPRRAATPAPATI